VSESETDYVLIISAIWIIFDALVVGSPIFCSSVSERGVSIGVGGFGIHGAFLAAALADVPAAAVERDRVLPAAIPATVLLFLDVLAVEIIDIDRVVAFTCICSYSAYLIRCPSKTMLYLPSGFKPSYDTCSSSKRRLQLVFSMVHTTSLQIEDTPRNRSQMSLAAVAP